MILGAISVSFWKTVNTLKKRILLKNNQRNSLEKLESSTNQEKPCSKNDQNYLLKILESINQDNEDMCRNCGRKICTYCGHLIRYGGF